jgi:hypothetical protein
MEKIITKQVSGKILLILFGILLILQALIMLGIIPYNIVWAGQLTKDNYIAMSLVSMVIIVVFIYVILVKMNIIKNNMSSIVGKIGSWIIFIYLILNTVGNIASPIASENQIFAIITLIMAIIALIFALTK